jgi:uncharacterized coiled-coil protein SlyX
MRLLRLTSCATGLAVALALAATMEAKAQTDTSQVRIPVRKGAGTAATGVNRGSSVTRRETGGDVDVTMLTITRVDSLEGVVRTYEARLDSLEAANASAASRTAALEARINALADSLATTRTELATARTELAAANAKITEVDGRLQDLTQRYNNSRNRTMFGNSGFYVGFGGGTGHTSGTLREIGYESAPQLTVPIGWHRRGSMLGLRTEWSMQRLEGVQVGSFFNTDPTVFSGTALVTLNFPFNAAKTNSVYVMGGGGFYQFRNFGGTSALADKFSSSIDGDTETKWGFNAGAGLEFHILGATSLFLQTSMTNVAADVGTSGEEGRNLRWMPITIGFLLR